MAKWVPILTAEDFNRFLIYWFLDVFGDPTMSVVAKEAFRMFGRKPLDGWYPPLTRAQKARLWNRTMKRLGYTEIYDA